LKPPVRETDLPPMAASHIVSANNFGWTTLLGRTFLMGLTDIDRAAPRNRENPDLSDQRPW
jgi:hypothetical protein